MKVGDKVIPKTIGDCNLYGLGIVVKVHSDHTTVSHTGVIDDIIWENDRIIVIETEDTNEHVEGLLCGEKVLVNTGNPELDGVCTVEEPLVTNEYIDSLVDQVQSPAHYNTGTIEVIDILKDQLTEEEFRGFCKGNVLKYTLRCESKGKREEDLKKAEYYLKKMLEE